MGLIRLWRRASLSIGALFFGEAGGGLVYRELLEMDAGGSGKGCFSLQRLRKGCLGRVSLAGDPDEGTKDKRLRPWGPGIQGPRGP
jgi:hypothetical protein